MAAVSGAQLPKQLSIPSVEEFKDDSLDPRVQVCSQIFLASNAG